MNHYFKFLHTKLVAISNTKQERRDIYQCTNCKLEIIGFDSYDHAGYPDCETYEVSRVMDS